MEKNNKAFTIVEIMIVVAIIAFLTAIAIPNLLRARIEANDASAKSALKTISNALEVYSSTENRYPTEMTSLITASPQYLSIDYFTGNHNGFTFASGPLTAYSYSATATPLSVNSGSGSFTISTGGVLVEN